MPECSLGPSGHSTHFTTLDIFKEWRNAAVFVTRLVVWLQKSSKVNSCLRRIYAEYSPNNLVLEIINTPPWKFYPKEFKNKFVR